MSSAAATSKPDDTPKPVDSPKEQEPLPHLGVLEEDDEFEEFPVQDWDDSQTDLAHLGGVAPGAAKSEGDKLWEDNWDDDDIEEEFSAQLRNELQKSGKGAVPMQH
ncbi:DSS1/SEM1 family-domain-containing protein [Lactifluus volemus]|nr:DSS1/SEM1 family-domain-containing protein [Lactifluus volemus]